MSDTLCSLCWSLVDDVTTRAEDQDIGSMDDDDMLLMEDPYMVTTHQRTNTGNLIGVAIQIFYL